MIDFKLISLEDKQLFEDYLNINKYKNSEYNFSTLYMWRVSYQIKYAMISDCLCFFSFKDGGIDACYFPLGTDDNVRRAFLEIFRYFKSENKPFRLISLSEEMFDFFGDIKNCFEVIPQPGYWDYVYSTKNFATLSGKKLQKKRNHYNYFINTYKHEFRDISCDNEQACLDKLVHWIDDRSNDAMGELYATKEALLHRDALDLVGKALYVEDEVVGVILGQYHHGMGLISIAKADLEYRGASVALFSLFVNGVLPESETVNLMEDLNLEGLRKLKKSYHPINMIEKFSLQGNPDLLLNHLNGFSD